MKKFSFFASLVLLLVVPVSIASADLYFEPDPGDLYDLDHHYYYTWGINSSDVRTEINSREDIIGINLIFYDIYNWSAEDSRFFVWLLDDVSEGVQKYRDSGGDDTGVSDEFPAGFTGIHLETYETPDSNGNPDDDIPYGLSNAIDITYSFSQWQIDEFFGYLGTEGDDTVGFGFDPDCHYYNNGIKLELVTVHEPATMLLFGVGLIGMVGLGRKKFIKR